ncbi:hypothetical protein [Aureimonas mangrovi]|uniref:hypothetical protein n=1 Tax=Aureimonas mangrovi TaxID=2758041 RepID=UPI00163DA0E4|nr:hypothetical protein [Aureimonas mangrovi]
MSALADRTIDLPLHDDLDAAVEGAVRTCGRDPRVAVRALILGQRPLLEQLAGAVSTGYVRGSIR